MTSTTVTISDSPPPKQQTKAGYRKTMKPKKLKVLNFVKNPSLAIPILELAKADGYNNTLQYGKKDAFYKKVKEVLFAPGCALGR